MVGPTSSTTTEDGDAASAADARTAAAAPLLGPVLTVRGSALVADIAAQAGPAVVAGLADIANEVTNTAFIGHYGNSDELAAIGIGNMMQNCFGLSIAIGLGSGLDTLASQAYGARRFHLACMLLQRSHAVILLQLLWVWPVLASSEFWLTLARQDPVVARLASEYIRAAAPFMLCFFLNVSMRGFLIAVLRPKGAAIVGFVCCALHVCWCELLVGHLALGVSGLGFAMGMSWTLRAIGTGFYLWLMLPGLQMQRKWVFCPSKAAARGWREFLGVALPALVQVCGEWWIFEICSLFVGLLGATALAAQTATHTVVTLVYMTGLGLSRAAASLVGNAIGAGRPAVARRTAWACLSLALGQWTVIGGMLISCRSLIVRALCRDEEVQRVMRRLLCIYALCGYFDNLQCVASGALRGLGKVKAASAVYLISFYLVMLPTTLLLMFPARLGVDGVWWGTLVGTAAAAASFLLLLARTDYEALAGAAGARLRGPEPDGGRRGRLRPDPL